MKWTQATEYKARLYIFSLGVKFFQSQLLIPTIATSLSVLCKSSMCQPRPNEDFDLLVCFVSLKENNFNAVSRTLVGYENLSEGKLLQPDDPLMDNVLCVENAK